MTRTPQTSSLSIAGSALPLCNELSGPPAGTNGEETPIYLPPAAVLSALPGTWDGTTSQAGWGTWLTARRVNA